MASSQEDQPPPSNSFLIGLPDGTIRIFEEAMLTVSDVLAEYPHHDLSLSPSRSLRLPPDTLLLPWNTYYLHRRAGTRTLTLDLSTKLDRDSAFSANSGEGGGVGSRLPPSATQHNRLRGISCQFYLPPNAEDWSPPAGDGGPHHARDLWPRHPSLEGTCAGLGPKFYTQSFSRQSAGGPFLAGLPQQYSESGVPDHHMLLPPTTPGRAKTPPPGSFGIPPLASPGARDVCTTCACGGGARTPQKKQQQQQQQQQGKERRNPIQEDLALFEAEAGQAASGVSFNGTSMSLRKSVSCGTGKERDLLLLELKQQQQVLQERRGRAGEQSASGRKPKRNAIMDEIMQSEWDALEKGSGGPCGAPRPPMPPVDPRLRQGQEGGGRVKHAPILDDLLLPGQEGGGDWSEDRRMRRVTSCGRAMAGLDGKGRATEWQNTRRNALLQELQMLEAEVEACTLEAHSQQQQQQQQQRQQLSVHQQRLQAFQKQRLMQAQQQLQQQQQQKQGLGRSGFLSRLNFGLAKPQPGRSLSRSSSKREAQEGKSNRCKAKSETWKVAKPGEDELKSPEGTGPGFEQDTYQPCQMSSHSSWNTMPAVYSCSAVHPAMRVHGDNQTSFGYLSPNGYLCPSFES